MHSENIGGPETVIRDRGERLGLRLDEKTGLPTALLFRQGGQEVSLPFTLTATLETGGEEVFVPLRNFSYVDTEKVGTFRRVEGAPLYHSSGPEETYAVTTEAGDWTVRWEYTFRQSHPRLELNFDISPSLAVSKTTLRDVRLEFVVRLPDFGLWRLEAPGNTMRTGVNADALVEPFPVPTAGGDEGSTGLVALHCPERRQVLVLWPFSRTEIGDFSLHSDGDAFRFVLATGLAGRISRHESLRYGAVELDVMEGTWEETRDDVPGWYATLGLSTPQDRPEWVETASIFEVQIGYSPFWGGYRYEPYPTVKDLLADLGRIKGLGFDALQIMPRQPYPSYNVHDYADVTLSYGDEEDLRALVDACHSLGMRVILDILMHGVIDREVIARAAERVRSGPYYDRLSEAVTMVSGVSPAAVDQMNVAWSRHILDFEPYWFEGSPPCHPLVDEHPEWFMRDPQGNVTGIYTKAFDVANVEWQEYFCSAAEELVRRLDIDGFRFDAPTYNTLPNWSESTEHRASYSALGCLQLFELLRVRLKRLKEGVMLYTEPSGVLFRQAMDATYNYDEHWLPDALLLTPQEDEQSRRTSVRNGRELAAWFRDRNAVLPPGSFIAHHIDSHDTFWWPLPGQKWRREQFGLDATRALLAVFSLSGGAYMTFVGGEKGIEEELRRVHRLRRTLPEVGRGAADYDAVWVDREAVYAVVRRSGSSCSVLLVNLSSEEVEATCSLDVERLRLDDAEYAVYDAWNERALAAGSRYSFGGADLRELRLGLRAFAPQLLVLRPSSRHGQGPSMPRLPTALG